MRRGNIQVRHMIVTRQFTLRDLPGKSDTVIDATAVEYLVDGLCLRPPGEQEQVHIGAGACYRGKGFCQHVHAIARFPGTITKQGKQT